MYYAKTNTADPRVGLITVGEYLTDAQEKALGEDLLNALVQRGVLGVERDGAQPVPAETGNDGADGENNSADGENNSENNGENNGADGEDAEDAPELDIADVAVVEAAEAPAANRGRRKSK